MATTAWNGAKKSLNTDRYERALATGAVILLSLVIAALARGYEQWGRVPAIVWAHLATILVALILTPVILLGSRGTQLHRVLGRSVRSNSFCNMPVRLWRVPALPNQQVWLELDYDSKEN